MADSGAVLKALKGAKQTQQLYMVYQPIFNLRTGRICAFEALMRWNSPEMGMVPPDKFISLLENSGQFLAVEEMVTKTPWETAAGWPEYLSLSINFSALELCDPQLPARVQHNLAKYGLDPRRCEIEVTETQPLCECQIAAKNMRELKALGITFALDDFGTGHANLDYLLRYPFDTLKMDKSFLAAVPEGARSAQLVEGIISLAHNVGVEALAEGVEEEAQNDWLIGMGCDKAQGFYFSPPIPPEAIPALLKRYS